MAKKNKAVSGYIWKDVSEDDFRSADLVDECEVGDYNKAGMTIYQANINYARQLARAEDSLKPVERRALYTCFMLGATPGHNVKTPKILGALVTIHNHSDDPAYQSIINMAQYWKKSAPMIGGNCNLGTIIDPDSYGAARYTELQLTRYAYECFFEDFDIKAITMNGLLVGVEEPDYLPSKFPNILVNGSSGIGNGFSAFIPPFNIDDIIEVCTKVIDNPDVPDSELVIAPDLPTDCDIVENESDIEQFCKTGRGKLTMRASIDIVDNGSSWLLVIKSIPYGVAYTAIKSKILALGKAGVINLLAIHDESDTYVTATGETRKDLYFDVEIPKAMDPKAVRHILFKNCELEKTMPMQMTVVTTESGNMTIRTMNMKQIIQCWLDSRRMYKRSLYNHKINKLISDIEIDNALIYLLDGKNLEKTVAIVRSSTSDNVVENLMNAYGGSGKLNSHQAKIIAAKPLSAFTKDAAERYRNEIVKFQETLDRIEAIAYSPKEIDKIILSELDQLRKYGIGKRRSKLITVDGESIISDTDHRLVITRNGHVKKLPIEVDRYHTKSPFGVFEQGDGVAIQTVVNNLDGLLMFNEFGKYSIVPVKNIPNTVYSDYGDSVYSISKLDGRVVRASVIAGKDFNAKKKKTTTINDADVIFLSKDGFVKRTAYSEYVTKGAKGVACIRNSTAAKIRPDDRIIEVAILPDSITKNESIEILVYTKYGEYVLLPFDTIISLGKGASGLNMLAPAGNDACAGFTFISSYSKYAVIVTKRGYMKKVELEYLAKSKKRKDNSYIATVENDDEIISIIGCTDEDTICVTTKGGNRFFACDTIPTKPRKSAPIKLMSVPVNDEITDVRLADPSEIQ